LRHLTLDLQNLLQILKKAMSKLSVWTGIAQPSNVSTSAAQPFPLAAWNIPALPSAISAQTMSGIAAISPIPSSMISANCSLGGLALYGQVPSVMGIPASMMGPGSTGMPNPFTSSKFAFEIPLGWYL
jgi:hypothetical protein